MRYHKSPQEGTSSVIDNHRDRDDGGESSTVALAWPLLVQNTGTITLLLISFTGLRCPQVAKSERSLALLNSR